MCDRNNGHLLRPTPAHSARGRWRQGAWCRRQLKGSGATVRAEAGWVGQIQQQLGELEELVPWDQHFEMQKYRRSNKEPD